METELDPGVLTTELVAKATFYIAKLHAIINNLQDENNRLKTTLDAEREWRRTHAEAAETGLKNILEWGWTTPEELAEGVPDLFLLSTPVENAGDNT